MKNIDKTHNAKRMFNAVKLLEAKPFENPKIHDSSGKFVSNPNKILDIVTNHFESKFNKQDETNIPPFIGHPKPLEYPITTDEVKNSFKSLSNNRAPGEDGIPGELLKYGPFMLDHTVANILNETFATHQPLDINGGVLITIQKAGKAKGPPQNLRPITLLNTIRKTLSTIVLKRIRPLVEEYLSKSQSGFRPDRSTSDVVWTHKWLAAKIYKENIAITITGIDMSAAFDTINRNLLIDILNGIIHDDELRMIHFLLSNTTIHPRIQGATNKKCFLSNTGTPQGDCLSPILFIIYLEHALKSVRKIIPNPNTKLGFILPSELIYADDIDFVTPDFANINMVQIQETLSNFSLKVNADKTELTTLDRNSEDWKKSKKVGTLIGDAEDVERRKYLSNAALHKLTTVWIREDKIKVETKLKLYRTLIKSILLYNCGTWALTKTQMEKLNAFHRQQLRKILNIKYPKIISNKTLYTKTNERPISLDVLDNRWRLFGHVLRRDSEIPANKSMTAYFVKCGNSYKGRPPTTLPIVLHQDLQTLENPLTLKTTEDLEKIKELAQDRERWKNLQHMIVKTAEASQSIDRDAKGP